MRRSKALRVGLVACLVSLAGCTLKVDVGDESWTADCRGVSFEDCEGVLRLFVNNLARSHGWIYDESDGLVRIESAPCPAEPHADVVAFLDLGACWRAEAATQTTRACMIVARQKDPEQVEGSGFGQAGGDSYTGLALAPEPGTTPC